MRVLLVNPYFGNLVYAPTLGLAYLATYIKELAGCDVEVLEPGKTILHEHQLLEKVKHADYLGLVCYTESRQQCFDFAARAKLANPDCKIVIGGTHATALDEEILRHYSFVDYVIRMEGENALLDLIQGKPLDQIPNLTWRSGDAIVRNPEKCLRGKIDHFHIDYDLIWQEIDEWKDDEIPYQLKKLKHLPIIASRGCPFQCAFCAAHRQWCGTWRGEDPEQLVNRMKRLVERYGIGYFRFYDALFIGNEKYVLEFCEQLEKQGLNIKFRIDIRAGTSQKVLKRLKEVGCEIVGYGIESGSERILKRINKRTTRAKVVETLKICRSLGYWVVGFFMMSLPDETWDDFQQTLELIRYFDVFNLQFFKIHPNTSFYEELKARGEIDDEVWFDRHDSAEIFYSKERFPSANFYRSDIYPIEKSIYHKHKISKPFITIKRQGKIRGVIELLSSALQLPMMSNPLTSSVLDSVKRGGLGRMMRSRRFVK